MLNRRNSRVKVMQVLYANALRGEEPIHQMTRELEKSLASARQMFFVLMDQLVSVAEYARTKHEIMAASLLPEHDEVPEIRLMSNPLLELLQSDQVWKERLRKERVTDYHDDGMTRHLFARLSSNNIVRNYIGKPASPEDEDEQVLLAILEEVMLQDDDFEAWLEEVSAWWQDDMESTAAAAAHLIRHLQQTSLKKQLAQMDQKRAEVEAFARDLLTGTAEHRDEYTAMIAPVATNWEVDRITVLDMVLMRMALCEILMFPTIPVKVTINEYIDISKDYSTPKSREFINGVLDKLMHRLRKEGKVLKTGRGLIET